jgi:hypothetical protein
MPACVPPEQAASAAIPAATIKTRKDDCERIGNSSMAKLDYVK